MVFPLRIGIHTSISKSLVRAAERAVELGANTFQIFSASPRMWRTIPPCEEATAQFRAARSELGLTPLVVHDSYLINLASCEPELRAKSIAAFRAELQRCHCLGADYLVTHPGNCKGQTRMEGLQRIAEGLAEAVDGLPASTTVLLENTAGMANTLGCTLDELAELRQAVQRTTNQPVGFCLDTCHAFASGYDIASKKGLQAFVEAAENSIGLAHVPVIHANDSQGALGSRKDRHAHIGEGHIGRAGFARILRHPALREKAFILETPQDEEGDEQRNIGALKELSLCRKSSTNTNALN